MDFIERLLKYGSFVIIGYYYIVNYYVPKFGTDIINKEFLLFPILLGFVAININE